MHRTGSIAERAQELDRFLSSRAAGRGVNLLAHSMGGLDGRHLITHIRPKDYTPLSLTTIATPHRGSPFMDWCNVSRSWCLFLTMIGYVWECLCLYRIIWDLGERMWRKKSRL